MKEIKIKVEKNDDGFFATVIDLEGCFAWGDEFSDMVKSLNEMIGIHILGLKEESIPYPSKFDKEFKFKFEMDAPSMFGLFKEIKTTNIATRSGINASLLRQYAAGIKKPRSGQLEKIERAIHDLGRDLQNISLA